MNKTLRSRFPLFRNEASLRVAIEEICAEFGKVSHLTVLRSDSVQSSPQCVCFLRLESPTAESKLKNTLNVFEFGGDITFLANNDEQWTSSRECLNKWLTNRLDRCVLDRLAL